MFEFCHHCGRTIGQEQIEGRMLVCRFCGKEIGVVSSPKKVVVDGTEERIRQGTAARCPLCQQAIEVKVSGGVRAFVPHFVLSGQRKMCPNSGKPIVPDKVSAEPAPARSAAGGKDLSAYMNREFIRVVACPNQGDPTIEELHLEYLDKTDRVRIQIEALRDILGTGFRMMPYPPQLNRPQLAVWGNATRCVIAKKHDQGGYQPMSETEIKQVVEDVRRCRQLFFQ